MYQTHFAIELPFSKSEREERKMGEKKNDKKETKERNENKRNGREETGGQKRETVQ